MSVSVSSIAPRALVLTLAETQSAQFEASGELRAIRIAHAEALRLDDQESALEARAFALLETSRDEAAQLALALLARAEAFDQQERARVEAIGRHADLGSHFQRTANGLLERAAEGLRQLFRVGRKREVAG